MLLNVFLESLRWNILDKSRSSNNIIDNLKTIFESITLSSASFGGVGEHLAKLRRSNNMIGSTIASLLGSIIQTSVIILMGIIGLLLSNRFQWIINNILLTILFFIVCFLLLIFLHNKFTSKIKEVLLQYSCFDIFYITLINILRYIVFSYQLYLFFTFDPSVFDSSLIANILVYYLIITIIPSVGLADIGIRGSIAIFIFGNSYMGKWTGVAIILIWLFNRVLPSIIGTFSLFKKN